jgi:hypothetical protein
LTFNHKYCNIYPLLSKKHLKIFEPAFEPIKKFADSNVGLVKRFPNPDPRRRYMLNNTRFRDPCLDDLAEREYEVLVLMAEGLTNRGISERLFVTKHSVEKYMTQVLLKVVGLPEKNPRFNRRVMAVLKFLEVQHKQSSTDF